MTSLAASIPPELFKNILSFVGHTYRLVPTYGSEGQSARREEMRNLSVCASTCVYWAQLTRGRMLASLVLRSYEDICNLRSLLCAPSSTRLEPIGELVHSLYAFYRLDDRLWFHNIGGLKAYGLRSLDHVVIHIRGPVPNRFTVPGTQAMLHPLFSSVPRALLMALHTCPNGLHIHIADIYLPTTDILYNLFQDTISLRPQQITCVNLTWDDNPDSPAIYLSKPGLSHRCPQVYASECTSDSLVVSMILFTPRDEHPRQYVHLPESFVLVDAMRVCANRRHFFGLESLSDFGSFDTQRLTGIRLSEGSDLCFGSPFISTNSYIYWIASRQPEDTSNMRRITHIIIDLDIDSIYLTNFRRRVDEINWKTFLDLIQKLANLRIVIQSGIPDVKVLRECMAELVAHLRGVKVHHTSMIEILAHLRGAPSSRWVDSRLELYSYDRDKDGNFQWTQIALNTVLKDINIMQREKASNDLAKDFEAGLKMSLPPDRNQRPNPDVNSALMQTESYYRHSVTSMRRGFRYAMF